MGCQRAVWIVSGCGTSARVNRVLHDCVRLIQVGGVRGYWGHGVAATIGKGLRHAPAVEVGLGTYGGRQPTPRGTGNTSAIIDRIWLNAAIRVFVGPAPSHLGQCYCYARYYFRWCVIRTDRAGLLAISGMSEAEKRQSNPEKKSVYSEHIHPQRPTGVVDIC